MIEWAGQLKQVLENEPCVMVTLALIAGSSPRESGCRMLVTRKRIIGSIGGGNLEYTATSNARALLESGEPGSQLLETFDLGPALNQCCGGSVWLLFEHYPMGAPSWLDAVLKLPENTRPGVLISQPDQSRPGKILLTTTADSPNDLPESVCQAAQEMLDNGQPGFQTTRIEGQEYWLEMIGAPLEQLYLFGAGHVGNALVGILAGLPLQVSWVDSRAGAFQHTPAANIQPLLSEDPLDVARRAPAGCWYLVMTHSHELDEDLCFEILHRDEFAWLGLIGSVTKRRRFVIRLKQRGISDKQLERLVCPIGIAGIKGKQPATIAVAVAAELLQVMQRQ